MNERLLQYIWQFQYYQASYLQTEEGEPLQIISPGMHNTNEGPDFINAKIKVGNTTFVGSIEIHNKASDWVRHKHQHDVNYNNVVLHVVWEQDKQLDISFPTLVLQHRISNLLLDKYQMLMQATNFIPCQQQISGVGELTLNIWKQRLMVERMQQRVGDVKIILANNNNHWEATFWQLLAKSFGVKVNSLAFENMAQSIPLSILAKHKNQPHQIEALLMGQCGLLNKKFEDSYAIMLQKEYLFLKQKYNLVPSAIPVFFLRMRPANFPTIRIAQLSSLITQSKHLFSIIKEVQELKDVKKLFDITANDYWHYHYNFEEITSYKPKRVGAQMLQNIIVNTVLPVLYAYGWYNNIEAYKNRALMWAEALPPEKNTITDGFEKLGISNKSAFDSQALIQLKNKYCNEKKCLSCAIGNHILKMSK